MQTDIETMANIEIITSCAESIPPELPLVTVVVPVYNRLQYVGAALESILAQTYANIEIIVVDDGSKVSVDEALKPYADRIRFYRQPNGGPSSARNCGIRHARGVYILFLDHDDILETHAIQTLFDALTRQQDAVWASGRLAYMDETGKRLLKEHPCRYESGDIYEQMIYANLMGTTSTLLLSVEIVRAAGGFDDTIRMNEDYDLWLRIAHDYPIVAVQEVVTNYRVHEEQVTNARWAKLYEDQFRVLSKNLAQARPGYEEAFANSKARIHLEFGDDWYVRGECARARQHWRRSLEADSSMKRSKLFFRYLKSYLPHSALSALRRMANWRRSDGNSLNMAPTTLKN